MSKSYGKIGKEVILFNRSIIDLICSDNKINHLKLSKLSGVSPSAISVYWHGTRRLSTSQIQKFAIAASDGDKTINDYIKIGVQID